MTPEERARHQIDQLLNACGWTVQDRSQVNLFASPGVAVREVGVDTGEADYLLLAHGKAIAVVEAKPEGYSLTGVESQSAKYRKGVLDLYPAWAKPLPFDYQSTGSETRFTNHLDPNPSSRDVFAFHRPETLIEWVQQPAQLNQRLRAMPPCITTHLWHAQAEAIQNLEESLTQNRRYALDGARRPKTWRQNPRRLLAAIAKPL